MTKPIRLFWGDGEERPYPNDFYNADEMDEYLAAKDARIAALTDSLASVLAESQRRTEQLDQLAAELLNGS